MLRQSRVIVHHSLYMYNSLSEYPSGNGRINVVRWTLWLIPQARTTILSWSVFIFFVLFNVICHSVWQLIYEDNYGSLCARTGTGTVICQIDAHTDIDGSNGVKASNGRTAQQQGMEWSPIIIRPLQHFCLHSLLSTTSTLQVYFFRLC